MNDIVNHAITFNKTYQAEMQRKGVDGKTPAWLHRTADAEIPSVLNVNGPGVDVTLV